MTLSIIVPVYNAEPYLHRCIDSIITQDYEDYELLLIDDGSSDRSGKICDNYAKENNHIIVIHKSNGGVGSARNVGLDNAKGEWVLFVDADDMLEPQSIGNILPLSDKQINLHSVADLYVLAHESRGITYSLQEGIFEGPRLKEFFAETLWEHVMRTPWAKLYRRDVIGDLRFDESTNIGEDTIFNMHFYSKVRSVCSSKVLLYHYIGPDEELPSKQKYAKTTNEASITLGKLIDAYRNVKVVCWRYECFAYYYTLSLTNPHCIVDYFRWITRRKVLQFIATTNMSWRFKVKQLIVWGSR